MLSHFTHEMVKTKVDRANRFVEVLKLELQGFVRAFRLATQADVLCLAVDMSMHERADLTKASEKGPTS